MKHLIITILMLATGMVSKAQIYEVGAFLGGSNLISDVGSDNYIDPNRLAVGVLVKWNRSPRYSYRGSFMYSRVAANDKDSDNSRRRQRGFAFKNTIKEASVGMEFNFFEFDLHEYGFTHTPYVYLGLSFFQYGTRDGDDEDFAIPLTVGYKVKLNERLILGAEIGARTTFTDNIDLSNPNDSDTFDGENFGNINSNDWFVFSGFTLTYTFGKRPCYCRE
jgi:hypothetical protein